MRTVRLAAARPDRRPPSFRRSPFARDVVFDSGGTTASRMARPHMLPSAHPTASAPAGYTISELNTHPMQSLCMLRPRAHPRRRNTRYQAGATPYLDRSSTGWIPPACAGALDGRDKHGHDEGKEYAQPSSWPGIVPAIHVLFGAAGGSRGASKLWREWAGVAVARIP